MDDTKANYQSTSFLLTIPWFIGTNWYAVKSHMVQLLVTRIVVSGIPLSYLIRDTLQYWEDTNRITSLQDRRIATKIHSGNSFDIDNKELLRHLSNTFSATTLGDVILIHQRTHNYNMACKIINSNVKGAR